MGNCLLHQLGNLAGIANQKVMIALQLGRIVTYQW
jgi:hypothetical protein